MHISEFVDFDQEDMGEPEKEFSLDEALQEKTTAEVEAPNRLHSSRDRHHYS